MGDVKLAAVLGLFLGRAVAVAVFAGVLSASLLGVVIMARLGVKRGRRTAVPFGPFLAFGGLLALFAGPQLVHLYLHSVV
jgi:leader peptidase (prepilin peptidase)/N-methyltransferase